MRSRWSQPAWQRTSALPSLPALIARLGLRSSCAGQHAIHVAPARCPPSALAMVSAVMAHLALVRLGGRGGVIGGGKPLGARPFGKHAEEAGNVVHDLAGVVVGEVAPEARLPNLPGPGDLLARVIVLCRVGT